MRIKWRKPSLMGESGWKSKMEKAEIRKSGYQAADIRITGYQVRALAS